MMISNSKESHLAELIRLFNQKPNKVVISSPFLSENIKDILSNLNFDSVSEFELVTTFKPSDPEQLIKPYILRDLFDYFNSTYPAMKVKVHIDNKLHGKLYLFCYDQNQSLIVSSANFTRNGLENNHEWGVKTDDSNLIKEIIDDLFECVEFREITYLQVERACKIADEYGRQNPDWLSKPKIHADILESVYSSESENNLFPKYFLKPLGDSKNPILIDDKRDFSKLHQNLHFSKKKPKGLRKGDVIITTGIGSGSVLSYFKVTGCLNHVTEEEVKKNAWKERWPWYLEGKNQSQKFGKNWWRFNLRRQDLLDEFLERYNGVPVTHVGGYNLDTINYGNDKVRITSEFGEFLISKIKESEVSEN